VVRGNSFGSELDGFVGMLPEAKKQHLPSKGQVLKMTESGRMDYFFVSKGQLPEVIAKHSSKAIPLSVDQFKMIYEVPRAVPAFIVFGKNTPFAQQYSDAWLDTLNSYYQSVDVKLEIQKHLGNK